MAERPILFSGPMVRAILEGRKTQTRRVVRGDAGENAEVWAAPRTIDEPWEWGLLADHGRAGHGGYTRCPYGAPGDTLWVRETWCHARDPITSKPNGLFHYKADGEDVFEDDGDGYAVENKDGTWKSPWRSPLYMPRWASRLTLRVTDVRVHRLHEVTEEDALAEGVEAPRCPNCGYTRVDCGVHLDHHLCGPTEPPSATFEFEYLWESINGKRAPWSSNPWVWAVTFEREEAPRA